MRYTYIRRKNGGYDTRIKWEKPVDGKTQYLKILALLFLLAGFFLVAGTMSQAETNHCLETSTNQNICTN